MSFVNDRNGPFNENGAFWSKVTGKILVCPPGLPRNGLSRPPGGALSRTSDPHGGATDVFKWNCASTNSYDLPSDARPEVVPVAQHTGFGREAGIAGEVEAGRSIGEHRALGARLEARHVELI